MEQGPSLEGIDPDRGAFVPRAFEPFGGGAGMGTQERGFSSRTLAPIGAPRGGGPDIPPLAGAGMRAPPSPGGAMRAAPFLGGGAGPWSALERRHAGGPVLWRRGPGFGRRHAGSSGLGGEAKCGG